MLPAGGPRAHQAVNYGTLEEGRAPSRAASVPQRPRNDGPDALVAPRPAAPSGRSVLGQKYYVKGVLASYVRGVNAGAQVVNGG